MTKSKKPKTKKQKEIAVLNARIQEKRDKLKHLLYEFADGVHNDITPEIIKTLGEAAKKYAQIIALGSSVQPKTLGVASTWYEACHFLYKAGLSHEVPKFFRQRIPVPSQSTAGASTQGRRNTLFGKKRLTDPEILALVTRPPMPRPPVTGGSVTGGSRKRRRT